MLHIRHDHINRTLCGLVIGQDQRLMLITQRQYGQRRAVEYERIKVCGRCARAAARNTVKVRR